MMGTLGGIDPEAGAKNKDDKSWLDKLAFWKSDKSGVDPKTQYRIQVQGDGSDSKVRVLTREGGVAARPMRRATRSGFISSIPFISSRRVRSRRRARPKATAMPCSPRVARSSPMAKLRAAKSRS